MSGVIVEIEFIVLSSLRSKTVWPSSHSSNALAARLTPSVSLVSVLRSSSMSSNQLSSPGSGTLCSLPNLRYLRSPRPAFSFRAFAASEFMRLNAAMDVRRGRGGERRGPCGDGASFGMSEKSMATDGADIGNLACDGLGEHGIMGLGSSIGDDVGDSDGNGDGSEYTELASD